LIEGVDAAALDALAVPLVATSSHRGDWLHRSELPHPCAWLMGHEGQGVSAELESRASRHVRIAQPGGEESLNVGAAAAIFLAASGAQENRWAARAIIKGFPASPPPPAHASQLLDESRAARATSWVRFGRHPIRRSQCFCLSREISRPPS